MDGDNHRLSWSDLPEQVRWSVAEKLGSPVAEAAGQRGGYGPGVAARCLLADGRRVFIKAASSAQNPDTPTMMRREGAIAAALPGGVPAPALLSVIDDGTWVVLVFEDVDGALPATPWEKNELCRVVRAIGDLSHRVGPPSLPSVVQIYRPLFTGWRDLAAGDRRAIDDPWCRDHIVELVDLEAAWEEAATGDRLVHGDLRSDNVLLTTDGRVLFVDWTSACVGAEPFDLLAMLPSVELEGGGTPEDVLELVGAELDANIVVPIVAAIAGYFAERGRLPDPPGLPTLRAFQRAQGTVTVAWLRRLLALA